MDFKQLLQALEEKQGSDLYLKVDQSPHLKISGQIEPVAEIPPVKEEVIEEIARQILDEKQFRLLQSNREMDISYVLDDGLRFRINFFYQQGSLALVARRIRREAQTFAERGQEVVLGDHVHLDQNIAEAASFFRVDITRLFEVLFGNKLFLDKQVINLFSQCPGHISGYFF